MQATFLLAGWTKEEPRTHIVRLVDASKVLAVKETLQPVTSYHAYSVQPSKPQVLQLQSRLRLSQLARWSVTCLCTRPLTSSPGVGLHTHSTYTGYHIIHEC